MSEVVHQLREWYESAPEGSTHFIVCVDQMDWSIFPVYVREDEDARKRVAEEKAKPLQSVKEVYRLDYSFDKQFVIDRCFTYELPLDGYDDHVLTAASELELDIIDPGIFPLQIDRLIRAERARRSAHASEKRRRLEDAGYDARKKIVGLVALDFPSTETDGGASGPSPIDATRAREEVDPPGVPPAPDASPSPFEDGSEP